MLKPQILKHLILKCQMSNVETSSVKMSNVETPIKFEFEFKSNWICEPN